MNGIRLHAAAGIEAEKPFVAIRKVEENPSAMVVSRNPRKEQERATVINPRKPSPHDGDVGRRASSFSLHLDRNELRMSGRDKRNYCPWSRGR